MVNILIHKGESWGKIKSSEMEAESASLMMLQKDLPFCVDEPQLRVSA